MPEISADLFVVHKERQDIDEIDEEIVALLRRRKATSYRIQHARLAAGGDRVDPARESAVAQRYRAAFGDVGVDVATVLLRLCRGDITAPRWEE